MPSKEAGLVKVDIDIVKEFGIEPSIASQIEAVFAPMVKGLKGFEKEYSTLMTLADKGVTPEVCAAAKRLRLNVGKVRISADKAREKEKAQYLLGGRAVDGVFNILKFAVNQKEVKLKEVEEHFERQEQEKNEKRAEDRREQLDKYGFDYTHTDLVNMEEVVFKNFVLGIKLAWDLEEAAKVQAEKDRIETERLAEEERQRIKDENTQLREEKEEREKFDVIVKSRVESLDGVAWSGSDLTDIRSGEVIANRDKLINLSAAKFKKFAKVQNDSEKQARESAEKKDREDQEAREDADRIKRENEAREEEDRQREEAAKKARITAAQAPDKAKILVFVSILETLPIPVMKSTKGKDAVGHVQSEIAELSEYLRDIEKGM